jgi:hypothetical protein
MTAETSSVVDASGLREGPGAREACPGPFPCQNSNNCIQPARFLQSNHLKTAYALGRNVEEFLIKFGIENCAFFTLTFAEQIVSPKEAQKRWHSLRSNVLAERYPHWLRVFERQKSERIHYHALVNVGRDVRAGVNWDEFKNGVYRSAGRDLRAEWAFWRKTAPLYKFGRTELMPIRSAGRALGLYVGKYIGKHIDSRKDMDKGVRMVEYSKGWKIIGSSFAWATPGARTWRQKLAIFAAINGIHDMAEMKAKFGRHWAHYLAPLIQAVELPAGD